MPESELPQSWQVPAVDAPTLGSGRYRLASKIGEGGMATVYRAWDLQTEQWLAVKVMLPEFAHRRKLRTRFANEARTMMELDHRNIVQVIDIGPDEDLPYIAMELADGGCVMDWIERYGPMPPRLAIDVIMQACKGLKAAHALGVVHRDVKPHNILITRRGRCQLTDFGIAQMDDSGMTKTNSMMGTMGYMAPEQRSNAKDVDARADIYGLGASLYRMLTDGDVADLFLAEHDASMMDGVPPSLVPVLIKATSHKRENRFDTVIALARALHSAKQELPPDPEDTPPLPIQVDLEAGGVVTMSDLSEPTFAELPTGLPDERDRRSAAPRAALPEPDNSLQPPSAVLPYTMSRNEVRNEDPDYLPDYLAEAPQERDHTPYDVQLDPASKAQLEADLKRAVDAGLLDKDGFIIEGRMGKGRGSKSLWTPLEDAMGLSEGAITELVLVIMRPLQVLTMSGAVALVVGGVTVGSWAGAVKEAQIVATSARSELFSTFDANKAIIDDLGALGADAGTLESFWFDYERAEGPEKVDYAYKVMGRLEQSYSHQRKFGENLRQAKVQLVHERLNRLSLAVKTHEQAMLEWEHAADTSRGKAAVSFGAATPPDM